MDKFASIRTFCSVAREGSFSAASRELGVSTALVSKQVKRLEDELGVRLLNRSTRHCSLTEAGAQYFDRCQHVLAYLDESDATVRKLSDEVVGTLKISAPATFGAQYVMPAIVAYKQLHPGVSINLRLSSRMPDLLEGGYDLALQAGGARLNDSELVARRLGAFRLAVAAAPDYLEQHGIPQHPNELRRHNCLIFHSETATDEWVFHTTDAEITVTVQGDVHANQGAALRVAAIGGCGIVRLPIYMLREDLAAGRLREVLNEYPSPPRAVHVLYPHRRLVPAKVRTFIDFLASRFENGESFEQPVLPH